VDEKAGDMEQEESEQPQEHEDDRKDDEHETFFRDFNLRLTLFGVVQPGSEGHRFKIIGAESCRKRCSRRVTNPQ
jgi:hypothetical protein